jgi:hypothetical protein
MATASKPALADALPHYLATLVQGWTRSDERRGPNYRVPLPLYGIASTQALIARLLPDAAGTAGTTKDQLATLDLLGQVVRGPMGLMAASAGNDEMLGGFLKSTGLNPWALGTGQRDALLETCFELGLAKTLQLVLSHPGRPDHWDRVPLFEHKLPLMHVAVMRGLPTLIATLKAGADPAFLHKDTTTLHRAASREHLAALMDNPAMHGHVGSYLESMASRTQINDFPERVEVVLTAMEHHQTLGQLPGLVLPMVLQAMESPGLFRNIQPLVRRLLGLDSPQLPAGWFSMPERLPKKAVPGLSRVPTRGKAGKTAESRTSVNPQAGWPLGAAFCQHHFAGGAISVLAQTTEMALQDTRGSWTVKDTAKGNTVDMPVGVWPFVALLALHDPRPRQTLTQVGLRNGKAGDVAPLAFLQGGDAEAFWEGVRSALDRPLVPFNRRLDVLVTLQDPFWHLPGAPGDFHHQLVALAESQTAAFSRHASDEIKVALHRAMQKCVSEALPPESRWETWVDWMGKGWFKSSESVSLLDHWMQAGGRHTWTPEWEKQAKVLATRIGKAKGAKMLIDKWRLDCQLDVAEAPKRKGMRL